MKTDQQIADELWQFVHEHHEDCRWWDRPTKTILARKETHGKRAVEALQKEK